MIDRELTQTFYHHVSLWLSPPLLMMPMRMKFISTPCSKTHGLGMATVITAWLSLRLTDYKKDALRKPICLVVRFLILLLNKRNSLLHIN